MNAVSPSLAARTFAGISNLFRPNGPTTEATTTTNGLSYTSQITARLKQIFPQGLAAEFTDGSWRRRFFAQEGSDPSSLVSDVWSSPHFIGILENLLSVAYYGIIGKRDAVDDQLIEAQKRAGNVLLPEVWDRYVQAAQTSTTTSIPDSFSPEDFFRPNESANYAKGVTPHSSISYNAQALHQTLRILLLAVRRHRDVEGVEKTLEGLKRTIFEKRHAPISESFLKETDIIIRHWALNYARINKISLKYENLEALDQIPEGALKVHTATPHDAIEPNFLLWALIPRIRFVADVNNYHDHLVMRIIGLAWFLDIFGLGYADRNKKTAPIRNKELLGNLLKNMLNFGVQPLFFPNQGRVLRAFLENGDLDEPGPYSNVINIEKPERYINPMGTANLALDAATAAGQPCYIINWNLKGSGFVMPKIAENPPFLQPNTTGQTVTHTVSSVIRVDPLPPLSDNATDEEIKKYEEMKKERAITLANQIVEDALRASGINALLQKRADEWGKGFGVSGAGKLLAKKGLKDERYYIIADRIRSVHPSYNERRQFKAQLMSLLIRNDVSSDKVADLLTKVSEVVKRTQYVTRFRRIKN